MSHVDVWGDNLSVHTPNIDSLAKDGAMFTHFYTSSPLCTPSRGTFMTGMYPPFTGTATNTGVLDAELKTWADILRDERGYKTSYMGKWHLDGDAKPVSILKDISCWKPCYDLKETTKSLNIYILHCLPFTKKRVLVHRLEEILDLTIIHIATTEDTGNILMKSMDPWRSMK